MNTKKYHIGKILFLGGAYCALSAGSGFGTGQELTQYFVVHGPNSLWGLWITQIITFIFGVMVIKDTRKFGLKTLDDVYAHYCGKIVGKILWVFNIAYYLAMCAVMISGAGASVAQYFHIDSTLAGRILMAVVVFGVCLLGLKKLLNINGVLGPIVLLFVIIVSVASLINPTDGVGIGAKFLEHTQNLSVSGSFVWSCFLYTTMCIFFQMPYWHACAANDPNTTEDTAGSCVVGSIIFITVQMISILAMISNASFLDGVQVPNLALAQRFNSLLAGCIGVVLLFAIFSTTIPMVWTLANIFTKEGTKRYYIAIGVIVVLSFIISGVGAFDLLLNWVFAVCSYVAILYVFPFLYTRFIRKPSVPDPVQEMPYETAMKALEVHKN